MKKIYGFENFTAVQDDSDEESSCEEDAHKMLSSAIDYENQEIKKQKLADLQERRISQEIHTEMVSRRKLSCRRNKKKKKSVSPKISRENGTSSCSNLSTVETNSIVERHGNNSSARSCNQNTPLEKEDDADVKNIKKIRWGFEAKERWEMKGNL